MYDKILVPLDGSSLSEVALPYAEELAGKLCSEILLLHVSESKKHQYDLLPDMYYIETIIESTRCGAQKHLGKLVATEIKVESIILVGDPAEEIVDYAEKEEVDFIVMATHGRTGISRWALGSVADKVVRASNTPVILIRAMGTHPDIREQDIIRRILVPLDGSKESEIIIPHIENLAFKLKAEVILFRSVPRANHVYGAEMTVAHVPYTNEEMEPFRAEAEVYLEKVRNQLQESGIILETKVTIGNAADAIIELSDEIPVDMVAMSTHGRSGIKRWSLGSVASKVSHAGNTPLLLVRMTQH